MIYIIDLNEAFLKLNPYFQLIEKHTTSLANDEYIIYMINLNEAILKLNLALLFANREAHYIPSQ
jgi:hypothetical protein